MDGLVPIHVLLTREEYLKAAAAVAARRSGRRVLLWTVAAVWGLGCAGFIAAAAWRGDMAYAIEPMGRLSVMAVAVPLMAGWYERWNAAAAFAEREELQQAAQYGFSLDTGILTVTAPRFAAQLRRRHITDWMLRDEGIWMDAGREWQMWIPSRAMDGAWTAALAAWLERSDEGESDEQ